MPLSLPSPSWGGEANEAKRSERGRGANGLESNYQVGHELMAPLPNPPHEGEGILPFLMFGLCSQERQ